MAPTLYNVNISRSSSSSSRKPCGPSVFKYSAWCFIICILISCLNVVAAVLPSEDSRLLTQWPTLMSHDSASGELKRDNGRITAYTKTQSVGLVGQLDCGARAFDYRPEQQKDGEIIAHHGSKDVKVLMSDSLKDTSTWLQSHPDELVIFYMSHFGGESTCRDATISQLKDMSIQVIYECQELETLTVQAAYTRAKVGQGAGALLAIIDCMEERFDPSVNCYGTDFVCYDSIPHNTNIPWNKMEEYLNKTTSTLPESASTLWMTQGHWQQSTESTIIGNLRLSDLLADEQKSGINKYLAQSIREKKFKYLTMLEVDNVCDGGMEILDAIKTYY